MTVMITCNFSFVLSAIDIFFLEDLIVLHSWLLCKVLVGNVSIFLSIGMNSMLHNQGKTMLI